MLDFDSRDHVPGEEPPKSVRTLAIVEPLQQSVRLGFAVDLNKPAGFIGKEALLQRKAQGPLRRRLVQVLLNHNDFVTIR